MATINASVPVPYAMTNAELIAELSKHPAGAIVSVSVTPGDRPWESGSKSIGLRYSS